MQLGMIGLGRMGANIVRRLMRDSHACVVYDKQADAVSALAKGRCDSEQPASPISSPSSPRPAPCGSCYRRARSPKTP